MWHYSDEPDPIFTDTLELDMGTVEPTIGPKRPQDKILVKDAAPVEKLVPEKKSVPVEGEDYALDNGDVVIAAITSCTNTSNPSVLIGAGLVARKLVKRLGKTMGENVSCTWLPSCDRLFGKIWLAG